MEYFYRVHKKGDIYTGMYESDTSRRMHDVTGAHPGPYSDKALEDFTYEHYFGFASIEQLIAWVHNWDWIIDLDLEGYVLSRVKLSKNQVKKYALVGAHQAVLKINKGNKSKFEVVPFSELEKHY